jgi:hypothetical protein
VTLRARAAPVEEIAMRFLVAAAAVFACLIAPIAVLAAGPAASRAAAPAGAAADMPAATAPTAADTEAAAKHEKRTACRKQAKAKRLVGADKDAFLKSCVAAK